MPCVRNCVTRWSVLAWVVLWLAVIAPGHERGMIRTDSPEKSDKASCCASHGSSESSDKKPSKDDAARHCALCYLNASLDLPLTFDLSLYLFGLLERLPLEAAQAIDAAEPDLPFNGRAPPAAIFA